jgi:hypothetical protein
MSVLLYIDPGSGSIIIQMLIAGGLAASLYFKRFYEKIKYMFKRIKNDEK